MKDCFSSIVSAFKSLCRDRFWQQVLWSEVRTLGPLGAPLGLLRALDSHPTNTKPINGYEDTIQSPNWLRKTTAPFNFTIKSRYSFIFFTIIAFHHITSHVKVSA